MILENKEKKEEKEENKEKKEEKEEIIQFDNKLVYLFFLNYFF